MSKKFRRTDEQWKAILLEHEQSEGQVKETLEKHSITANMLNNARERFGLGYKRGDARNIAVLTAKEGATVRKGGIAPAKRQKALDLFLAGGMSVAEIARQVKVQPQAVHYWVKQAKKEPAARPAAAASNVADVTTAINLLRKMDKEVTRMIRQHKLERADYAHQLGLMALKMLTGDE